MTFIGRPGGDPTANVDYSIIDFEARAADAAAVTEWMTDWLDSPPMTELFGIFGHSLASGSPLERIVQAERVTHDVFDFRQGGERWEARRTEFDETTTRVADELISLLFREPSRSLAEEIGPVDHALVLGGRINSCVLRGELMARLVEDGLEVGHVWGLGSRREVTTEEVEFAAELGSTDVRDELDAMTVALVHTLGLDPVPLMHNQSNGEVRHIAQTPLPVTGLAAPAGDGKARATTSDTYRYFSSQATTLRPADRVLVVTSAIHAPFQHAQAIAELGIPTGVSIVSVGAHLASSAHASVRRDWTTAEWLQEVRSAVWSMKQMYLAVLPANPSATP
ncbi:MAG: hypothetical protein V7697_28945 [Rhodococcus erythropolis]